MHGVRRASQDRRLWPCELWARAGLRRVCLSARHPRQPEWVRCARSRYPHSWASRGASPQRAEPHGRCSPRRRPHRRPRPRPPRLPLALPSHRPMPRPQTLPQGLSYLRNPAGWARRGRPMRRRAAAEHPRCQGPLQRPLLGRRGSAERAPPARANRWARHQRRRGRRRWRTGPRPALTGTRPTRCAKRSATRAASAPPRLPRRPPLSSLRAGKLVTLCMHHQVDRKDTSAAECESSPGDPADPADTDNGLACTVSWTTGCRCC